MKKTLLTAILLSGISLNTSAAFIDFEGFADDTLITDQYASLGIIFEGTWIENGYPSRGSGINWVSGEVDGGTYNGINPGAVSGYFVNPLDSSVKATTNYLSGLAVYPDTGTPVRLEVFDSLGNLLATDQIYDDGVLSIAVEGIASFSFFHLGERIDDVLGYDDIAFNDVSPVPEPSVLLLMASGLAGLGWSKKRG